MSDVLHSCVGSSIFPISFLGSFSLSPVLAPLSVSGFTVPGYSLYLEHGFLLDFQCCQLSDCCSLCSTTFLFLSCSLIVPN